MRLLFLLITCLFCVTMVVAQPTARNLGTPVKSMTIWGQLLVKDPVSGRPVYYAGTYTSAGCAKLIRFDYGENRTEYFPLPGTKGGYGLCEGPDGKIYVGTVDGGKIFSFNPFTKKMTDHGSAAGEMFVWTLHMGPDGRIYGATYPNAKVVVYDPSDDKIYDLGRMHPTEQYCRDLAVADNGRIFCGIGDHADIVAYDPTTKKKKSILPEIYKSNSFAYTMDSEDNVVYAFLLFDQIVLIFDADTYELLLEVRHPEEGKGVYIFRQMSGEHVLISGLPGGYMRFNKTTRQLETYDVPSYSCYDKETGIAYTRTNGGQVFGAYNTSSGEYLSRVDISKDGEGMNIFSLGTGPDGCIYGGVYNLLHLFRYDPSDDILEDLGVPIPGASGEFYSFCIHDGKLYMASYTYSVLSVYDPSMAWNPGTSNDSNPRKIGPVGDEQYRPPGLVAAADGKIYIGSIATYGKYGGALSVYDPLTDDFKVHRHIIPNQSIVSLTTSSDGWIVYGGSSIHGDYKTPIAKEAHFFAWDIRQGKMILDIIPVAGEGQVQPLVTAPDGRIYGCAGGTLFIYDSELDQIIYKGSASEGYIFRMITWEDGLIYGISGSSVFRMKPISQVGESPRFERLFSGGRDIAIDPQGRIYFSKGIELYVLENLPTSEPPTTDLKVYEDKLASGWNLEITRAEVDLASKEKVDSGNCQKIDFDRFCSLQYLSPDPWSITLWEYKYLTISINPGNSTINEIVVGKTGSGNAKSVSLLSEYGIALEPDMWTKLNIPTCDLGWDFGSRLESLKFTVLGSGTFYLDSISIDVPEPWFWGCVLGLVLMLGLKDKNRHLGQNSE